MKTLVACPDEGPSDFKTEFPQEIHVQTYNTNLQTTPFRFSCPSGHVITDRTSESPDGVFSGWCDNCGERFDMKRPGGVTPKRVLALITLLAEDNWGDMNAVILEHASVRDAVEADAKAARECQGLLSVATALLEQRLMS